MNSIKLFKNVAAKLLCGALLITLLNPLHQVNTLLHRPDGVGVKRGAGGCDRRINIGLVAQGNFGHDLLGRRIFNPRHAEIA